MISMFCIQNERLVYLMMWFRVSLHNIGLFPAFQQNKLDYAFLFQFSLLTYNFLYISLLLADATWLVCLPVFIKYRAIVFSTIHFLRGRFSQKLVYDQSQDKKWIEWRITIERSFHTKSRLSTFSIHFYIRFSEKWLFVGEFISIIIRHSIHFCVHFSDLRNQLRTFYFSIQSSEPI